MITNVIWRNEIGKHRLLLTRKSFNVKDKNGMLESPTAISSIATIIIYILILKMIEYSFVSLLVYMKFLHPLLEKKSNCEILARNISVRALCTLAMTIFGIMNREKYKDLTNAFFNGTFSIKGSNFENRLFTYDPNGHRCSLIFCSYQIVNLIASIQDDDEWIHLVHHSVSVIMAWLCMHPGNGHYYVLASSITEIPAFLSSLYINFDHGGMKGYVPGLGETFPNIRLVLLILTGASFILCRICFWMFVAFQYIQDLSRVNTSNQYSNIKMYKYCTYLLALIQMYLLSCVFSYIPIVLESLSFPFLLTMT